MGVKVQELSTEGSAYTSDYRNVLVGMKLSQVMDINVSNMSFENVMDCIIQAPSPVKISFVPLTSQQDQQQQQQSPMLQVGTMVEIRVLQSDNKEDKVIQAKVGDNLRKVLLDNQVELYKGLKKKLGNCGGGGQCTFCAVDFVQEGEGWGERSDYENQKIAKMPKTARLACLNNVQGPATIRVA
jgi:ferredoxin